MPHISQFTYSAHYIVTKNFFTVFYSEPKNVKNSVFILSDIKNEKKNFSFFIRIKKVSLFAMTNTQYVSL